MTNFRLLGETGITQSCLIELDTALAGPIPILKATVLTKNEREHLFVLWESFDWPYVGAIIPSGFMSGYGGEGGRGFSLALCMIHERQIPIEHLSIGERAFDCVDSGAFPVGWHRQVDETAKRLQMPITKWIFENHWQLLLERRLWRVQRWKLWNSPMDWPNPAYFVDKFSWDVGDKLYAASVNLTGYARPEMCQQAGLMLRDAWIEFGRVVRSHVPGIDEGIGKDDVKSVLDEIQLPEQVVRNAKNSLASSNRIQHDRGATPRAAERCFNDSAKTMAEIIEIRFSEESDPRGCGLISTN